MVDASAAPTSPKLRKQSSSMSSRSSKRALHCNNCGVRTHRGSKIFKVELKNDEVHNGVCIRCNLPDIPPVVRNSWIKQNSSHNIAPIDDKVPVKPVVKSTKVVEELPVEETVGSTMLSKPSKDESESPTDFSSDDSTEAPSEAPSQSPDTSVLYDEAEASLDRSGVSLEFENPSSRDYRVVLHDKFAAMLNDPEESADEEEELLSVEGKNEEELYDEEEPTMVSPKVELSDAEDVVPEASPEEEPIMMFPELEEEEELLSVEGKNEEDVVPEASPEEEPIMMFPELKQSPAAYVPEVSPKEEEAEEIIPSESDPMEPVVPETRALPVTETSGDVMLADPASSSRHRRTMMLAGAAVAVTGVAVAINLNNKKASSKAK